MYTATHHLHTVLIIHLTKLLRWKLICWYIFHKIYRSSILPSDGSNWKLVPYYDLMNLRAFSILRIGVLGFRASIQFQKSSLTFPQGNGLYELITHTCFRNSRIPSTTTSRNLFSGDMLEVKGRQWPKSALTWRLLTQNWRFEYTALEQGFPN